MKVTSEIIGFMISRTEWSNEAILLLY